MGRSTLPSALSSCRFDSLDSVRHDGRLYHCRQLSTTVDNCRTTVEPVLRSPLPGQDHWSPHDEKSWPGAVLVALEGQRAGAPFAAAVSSLVLGNAQVHHRSPAHVLVPGMVGSDGMAMGDVDETMSRHRVVALVTICHHRHHTGCPLLLFGCMTCAPCRVLHHAGT